MYMQPLWKAFKTIERKLICRDWKLLISEHRWSHDSLASCWFICRIRWVSVNLKWRQVVMSIDANANCSSTSYAFTNTIVASFSCASHKLSWDWEDCGSFLVEWNDLSFISRTALLYFILLKVLLNLIAAVGFLQITWIKDTRAGWD